ncbi:hypothetical protein MC885_004586 [Smutsia gigantea]|nr:hypothetical protein MC885_004586 [Smutsia gigantea]
MLCALLLLPSLLGAALAGPTPDPQGCAEGSAVWCQDLQAAARCGAVGYCRAAVWSQPTAKSLPCDVCLDVMTATSNGLNPDTTETNILALVKKACEWLPNQEAAAKCKEMVGAHRLALLSMLDEALDSTPAQVCTALTLCQPLQRHLATLRLLSKEDTSEVVGPLMAHRPLSFQPPQIPGDTVCQDCVQLVARLQDTVGSNLSDLAEVTTQETCESLGPGFALLCKNYIHRFFAPVEQTLRLVVPKEICGKGGFCEGLKGPAHLAAVAGVPSLEPVSSRRKTEVQMKAGLTCEMCQQVVQELEGWLESNQTEVLITHALEHGCTKMPMSIIQECITLVDAYSPSLVQLLTKVTPERVCKAIRLCSSQRRARAVHEASANPLPPMLSRENQGIFCNGCKRLFAVSARNLKLKSTERSILKVFKSGCSILPLSYMAQCNRFLAEYEPVLMDSLRDIMDPVALCTNMGACHAPKALLLSADRCAMGPSFWCMNQETAEMCNAVEHCQQHAWEPAAPTDVLFGCNRV